MKKSLSILLALGMLFLSAPGCSGEKNPPENMERITDAEMIAAAEVVLDDLGEVIGWIEQFNEK